MKIIALIFILLFKTSVVFACSCVNTANLSDAQHSKYLKKVKAIFYGEVVEKGEKREEIWSKNDIRFEFQAVKFKVLRAWKGIETATVTVETNVSSSCQYNPEIGSKIMVYAYESKESKIPLQINYCSVGKFNQEQMEREYGEGEVFEESQQQTQQDIPSQSFISMIRQKFISIFL